MAPDPEAQATWGSRVLLLVRGGRPLVSLAARAPERAASSLRQRAREGTLLCTAAQARPAVPLACWRRKAAASSRWDLVLPTGSEQAGLTGC